MITLKSIFIYLPIFTIFITVSPSYAELTKGKSVYQVDFSNPKNNHTRSTTRDQPAKDDTTTADPEFRILFFGKSAALLINPKTINNTQLEFGDSHASSNLAINDKVAELKKQGVDIISCEDAISNTADDEPVNLAATYSTGNNSAELAQLKALGYICIKPVASVQLN